MRQAVLLKEYDIVELHPDLLPERRSVMGQDQSQNPAALTLQDVKGCLEQNKDYLKQADKAARREMLPVCKPRSPQMIEKIGGRGGTRTRGPLLAKQTG